MCSRYQYITISYMLCSHLPCWMRIYQNTQMRAFYILFYLMFPRKLLQSIPDFLKDIDEHLTHAQSALGHWVLEIESMISGNCFCGLRFRQPSDTTCSGRQSLNKSRAQCSIASPFMQAFVHYLRNKFSRYANAVLTFSFHPRHLGIYITFGSPRTLVWTIPRKCQKIKLLTQYSIQSSSSKFKVSVILVCILFIKTWPNLYVSTRLHPGNFFKEKKKFYQ